MPLAPQSVLGGPNPNPNHHPHRRCLAGAAILLPKHEVEAMLDAASARDGEVYWRAITLRLGKIEFNANDGLDQVELALIAGEFASSFDADGDGMTTVAEIARQLRSRVRVRVSASASASSAQESGRAWPVGRGIRAWPGLRGLA